MERKAVSNTMSPMSRRSRELRSSKNSGAVREAQVDITSTSKILEVGNPNFSDARPVLKGPSGNSSIRRVSPSSQKANGVHLFQGLEAEARGTKLCVKGPSTKPAASDFSKSSANVTASTVARKLVGNGAAGQSVIVLVPGLHIVNSKGSSPQESNRMSDVAEQSNGRAWRARQVTLTPVKKTSKRSKRFQEVALGKGDGAEILGRRIKVFWPLDNKWFYGLVRAYNSGRRLHKIVYDDQDEEWVKLHKERFKLQVSEGGVFGTQQRLLSRQSFEVPRSYFKGSHILRVQTRVLTGEFGKGVVEVASSALADTVVSQSSNFFGGLTGERHETQTVQEKSGARNAEANQQPGLIIYNAGVGVGAVAESMDNSTRLCEGVDLEVPYAVDSTSTSDSLDTFWRSNKQCSEESGKHLDDNGSMRSSADAVMVAKPIKEFFSANAPLLVGARSNLVTSNLSCTSEDVVFARLDSNSSTDDTGGIRGGYRKMSPQGDSTSIGSRAAGTAGGVASSSCSLGDRLLDSKRCSEVGVSEQPASENGNNWLGDEDGSSETELRRLDFVPVEGKENLVRQNIKKSGVRAISRVLLDTEGSISQRLVQGNSYREVHMSLWTLDRVVISDRQGFASKSVSAHGILEERGSYDQWQLQSLTRSERFISQHIATNLVNVVCIIHGQHNPTQSLYLDNVWRAVPHLTLFVSSKILNCTVGSNSWHAFLTCCRKEQIAKCSMLQHRDVLALELMSRETSLLCPLPKFATLELVDSGAQLASCNGSVSQLVLDGGKSSMVVTVDPPVEDMPPLNDVDMDSDSVPLMPQHYVPKLVEQTVPGAIVPGVQGLACGEENICQEVDIHSNGFNCICGGEGCPTVSIDGPTRTHYADDSVVGTANLANSFWNTGMITEVHIGGVVERWKEGPIPVLMCASESVDTFVLDCHQRSEFHDCQTLRRGSAGTLGSMKELEKKFTPSRFLDDLKVNNLDGHKEHVPVNSLSVRGSHKCARAGNNSSVKFARGWKSAKRGFAHITDADLKGTGLQMEGRTQELLTSNLVCMSLAKRQKVHVECFSTIEFASGNKETGEKDLSPLVERNMNAHKSSKSADLRDCELSLPRVNVLKLRRCPTNKGLWRVAGNSYLPERGARSFGKGGEPVTPYTVADRKRSFSHCLELYQPESPEEYGQSFTFLEGLFLNGQESPIVQGTDDLKVKEIWSNCKVSSIQDATSNSRKRPRNSSTSSVSSDDTYAPHLHVGKTYWNEALNDHAYSESLSHGCIANVLVVQSDRGWREAGACIELQSGNGQSWVLVVSLWGENVYAYKAEQAMPTGTTNRYTHAIVWKGGKGWSLEFDNQKQWKIFRDLHEDCFQRNSKVSSVRHIPIPGVKHIEDIAPRSLGCHFTRPYSRYILRVEDEVDMALTNSRVVYDMDSEDEQWLAQVNSERASARGTRSRPLIAEETLERLMDKLEKDAYMHLQQHKGMELASNDVAADSCNGLASQDVIKGVHAYWLAKRMRKGMPLVRHFQPPPWEQYQKHLQVWEQGIADLQQQSPMMSRQQLVQEHRKPLLFAFCLRPRGLEGQHKLLKQRSHRKQTCPGTGPRHWIGLGTIERQCYTERINGLYPGLRRPGRPRLVEEAVKADMGGSFNSFIREPTIIGRALPSADLRSDSLGQSELGQRRAQKGKKVGCKARRLRLLAAAEESRRNRLLLRSKSLVKLYQQPDVAVAAVIARGTADAAHARAQALYAVADAAMHKAVAAVVAADALYSVEQQQGLEEVRSVIGEVSASGPSFGSWCRAMLPGASEILNGRASNWQGLVNEDDALLPVASWSEELGAGLGTQLLNKDTRVEGLGTQSACGDRPLLTGELGRTRGESMLTMLTR